MEQPIKSKVDIEGARKLVARGFPEVLDYADVILEWCIDPNYPVAREVLIPFCASSGGQLSTAMRHQLRRSMRTRDYSAITSLLSGIVLNWPRESMSDFHDYLLNIVMDDKPGEDHAAYALLVLAKFGLTVDDYVKPAIPGLLERHTWLVDRLPRERFDQLVGSVRPL